MKFKAGDRLRVVIDDGTVKEIRGTVFEGEEVFEEEAHGKMIYKGLFFRMEEFVWDESGCILDRCVCHYCGKFCRYDKKSKCEYTELDGILRLAKKVEKIQEVGNEATYSTS